MQAAGPHTRLVVVDSLGFGKTFVNLDNGALQFDGITDIESTVKFVTDAALAEAGRIGIMSGSHGGYTVQAALQPPQVD